MGRQAAAAHCEDGARSRIMRAPLKAFTPPMYLQRLRRLAARLLGRCMLAWFALSIAVAAAAPLVAAQDMELICSSTGVVKLIVKGDEGSSAMGASQSKSGLGDMTVGAALGYHHSPRLHSAVGLDAILPTGRYDKGAMANTGRNYSSLDPLYTLSYIDPAGFNGDLRLGYLINRRNSATDYRSGNEFHFDYAAGWAVGGGWTLGGGGDYHQQLGLDRQGGVELQGSKTRALAIGPNLKYDSGKGWFVTAKWQFETRVRNGTQGNALWVKAVLPL